MGQIIFTNQIEQYKPYTQFSFGDYTYGTPHIYPYNDKTKLNVGKFCSFSEKVTIILGGEHRTDWVTTYPFPDIFLNASSFKGHPKSKGDIVIGHDVWVGYGATILSGVTIGNGAVIGAESVVTKDVPPYAIVGGNPAKIIKYRFPWEVIDDLQKIAWWDWPPEKIVGSLELLLSENIKEFIKTYKAIPL